MIKGAFEKTFERAWPLSQELDIFLPVWWTGECWQVH